MAIPRYDLMVSQSPAGVSFTTSFEVLNYSQAAVQIAWTGFNNQATLMLRGSNQPFSNYQDILCSSVTLPTGSGNHLCNIYQIGYGYMQVYFDPGSNSTGSFEVTTIRKSFA